MLREANLLLGTTEAFRRGCLKKFNKNANRPLETLLMVFILNAARPEERQHREHITYPHNPISVQIRTRITGVGVSARPIIPDRTRTEVGRF